MRPYLSSPTIWPREKIQSQGVEMLQTHELLSVILGSGSKAVPVHTLAKKIAAKLQQQKNIELAELQKIKGIGLAKACQIMAAIELVERLRPSGYPLIDSLDAVLNQVSEIRYIDREHIVCLYLNARMQLIHKETLAVGSVNQSFITPRDIFAVIKHYPITFLILAHNHPTGDPSPSAEDLKFTRRLTEAAKLLGMELLDHVIVAKGNHYSCKEHHDF